MQVGEVRRAALGEVAVRLGGGADRDRRVAHQLRVGRLLATEDDDRTGGAEHDVEPVLPRPHRTEQPHHDEVGAAMTAGSASSTSRRDGLASA